MNYISFVFCLLALILPCLRSEGSFDQHVTKDMDKHRSSRKYDTPYRYPGKYGDDRDETEDDDLSSDSRVAVPPEDDKAPSYSNAKGYDFGSSYPPFYKGYPFIPYWKGKGHSNADTHMPAVMNPMKMMEMMMMMKTMQDVQQPTKDEGSLTKFLSDSKSFLMAAIVPLSIILAAVVPVLINYMMTGTTSPLIQTTASTKKGRSIVDSNILEDIFQKFEEISRHIETDECAEKTLCKVMYNDSSALKGHVRKVASTVANLVKDDWIKDFKIKRFVKGLTEGNCDNVCKSAVSTPRQEE